MEKLNDSNQSFTAYVAKLHWVFSIITLMSAHSASNLHQTLGSISLYCYLLSNEDGCINGLLVSLWNKFQIVDFHLSIWVLYLFSGIKLHTTFWLHSSVSCIRNTGLVNWKQVGFSLSSLIASGLSYCCLSSLALHYGWTLRVSSKMELLEVLCDFHRNVHWSCFQTFLDYLVSL